MKKLHLAILLIAVMAICLMPNAGFAFSRPTCPNCNTASSIMVFGSGYDGASCLWVCRATIGCGKLSIPHEFKNCYEAEACVYCDAVSAIHRWEFSGHGFTGRKGTYCVMPICGGCGEEQCVWGNGYGHEFAWARDVAGHWEECARTDCAETRGYAVHSANTVANCTEAQVCAQEGCGYVLAEALGHDHTLTGTEYTGTAATCVDKARCGRCGDFYGEPLEHDFADAWTTDGTHHWHVCKRDGCAEVDGRAQHAATGDNEANCTTAAKCDACGESFGTSLGHDASGAAATCTTDKVCARSGCNHILENRLGHDIITDVAIAATCTATGLTEGSHCSRCSDATIERQTVAALGHKYRADVIAPACAAPGFTIHACSRCTAAYRDAKTSPLGHLYDEWTAHGGGAHAARCLRRACGHTLKRSCVMHTAIIDEKPVTVCLICGRPDEETLALFENTLRLPEDAFPMMEDALAEGELPRGKLPVRGGELADGTQLMLIAFEYDGAPETSDGIVSVILPADALEGVALYMAYADGSEIEIPHTIADGLMRFALDYAALDEDAKGFFLRIDIP